MGSGIRITRPAFSDFCRCKRSLNGSIFEHFDGIGCNVVLWIFRCGFPTFSGAAWRLAMADAKSSINLSSGVAKVCCVRY